MKLFRTALVAACVLWASAAVASPRTIEAKIGGTYDARDTDRALCETVAQRAPVHDLPQTPMMLYYGTTLASGVGSLVGDLIAAGIRVEEMRGLAQELCMHSLGYAQVPLTADEETAYRARSGSERDAWERTFLATDLSPRILPLITPKVPPLPGYRAEPFTIGSIKIDPDSLKQVGTDIEDSGVVVTGTASRSRTAVLTTPIKIENDDMHFELDAGTVMHQVDYRNQTEPLLRPANAAWCGQGRKFVRGFPTGAILCVTGADDYYLVYETAGQAWYAGLADQNSKSGHFAGPVTLEERPQDDLGQIGFSLSISYTSVKYVDVTASVVRDGKTVTLFVRELKYSGPSVTVLPLWNKRLVIKKVSLSRVSVTLADDGDGRAWRGDL